ncbi:hypothetical protein PHET_10339 [Paragonimus heterotremus]|uniref:Legumain n=1 Tax=Paragonimus heterotremus TaxID=100268 RepID=A0A8J4WDU2_9TREM|nr:hypothetical protein PHET_10339 [Paragonimus heterotremus]
MPRVSASVIAIICLLGLTQALNSHSAIFNSDPKKNWAVLVAGSNGWWNYRHQSDVCHAYQILTGLGIPRENIITFMYDDIANNRDYSRNIVLHRACDNHVNSDRYTLSDISELRVPINGFTPGDGHQLSGCEFHLYARQLNETITYMYKNKRYNQMVLYIEACHSGSMFHKVLSPRIQVYATTAAKPFESSSATFCEDKTIEACLADEYSYNWMTDTETHDIHAKTLDQQFNDVKKATTYSHVMKYGDTVPEVAQHVSKFHQLCRAGYQPEDLIDSVMHVCA